LSENNEIRCYIATRKKPTRNDPRKYTLKELLITVPKGVDKKSYIKGLQDGIRMERELFEPYITRVRDLEGCLEKLPEKIDEVAEKVRRKLDLENSDGTAVFDVAISMLKDELEKETKP